MPADPVPTVEPLLAAYDQMMERYAPHRQLRFDVIADAVTTLCRADARVVDVGCGPGSLSRHLIARIPGLRLLGLDVDPYLLSLARSVVAQMPGAKFRELDVTLPGWGRSVGPVDAVVTASATHYLDRDTLGALYRECAECLNPGGILINSDDLALDPATSPPAAAVARTALARHATAADHVGVADWASWWRRAGEIQAHGGDAKTTAGDHRDLLRTCGFAHVDVLWQHHDAIVLLATMQR